MTAAHDHSCQDHYFLRNSGTSWLHGLLSLLAMQQLEVIHLLIQHLPSPRSALDKLTSNCGAMFYYLPLQSAPAVHPSANILHPRANVHTHANIHPNAHLHTSRDALLRATTDAQAHAGILLRSATDPSADADTLLRAPANTHVLTDTFISAASDTGMSQIDTNGCFSDPQDMYVSLNLQV